MTYFFPKNKILLISFLLMTTPFADEPDEAYVNLIERLDAVERRLGGQTTSGADTASQEDVDSLHAQIKELRGRIEELEHRLSSQSVPSSPSRIGAVSPVNDDMSDEEPSETQHYESLPSSQLGERRRPLIRHQNQEEKKNISVDDEALDDLLDSLDSETNTKRQKVQEDRNRATENATKNAPTASLEMNDATAQYNQAMALYNKKAYPEAEEAFKYYLEQYKSGKMTNAAKVKIAHCQLEIAKRNKSKNEAKKAVKEFATLYKSNPKGDNGAEALLGLGEAVTLSGDPKKACLVLKKVRADFPKRKEVNDRAAVLMKQNKCS